MKEKEHRLYTITTKHMKSISLLLTHTSRSIAIRKAEQMYQREWKDLKKDGIYCAKLQVIEL